MSRAQKLLHEKLIDELGNIEELVIWAVPKTSKYPDGIRYRFVYVNKVREQIYVLYDNHYPKGHHRHIKDSEEPYPYKDIRQLIEDFKRDVQEVMKHENS